MTLAEKAEYFADLHRQPAAFIIPNPWDIGGARILAQFGFKALATTSAGHAFSIGRKDDTVPREAVLSHLREIAGATDLPVSADLGKCFGDTPGIAAETIALAGATGIVGGSIEDATCVPGQPIYEKEYAVDRVRAAAESARKLPYRFTLTARCENYLHGRKDLRDTIDRLQAYQAAGADVLFAPGLATKADIAEVVRSLDRPLNVVMGLVGVQLSAADLSELGVKRISVGSSLARAALGAFVRAAKELSATGTFSYADSALSSKDANAYFG